METLQPKLRFPEFSGVLKTDSISDLTSYVDYRGKTPVKSETGIFLVTAKNIKQGYIDYENSKEYITKESYEEVMRRGKPKIGDVLITTEAPLGNIATIDNENIALAQRVIKYRGNEGKINNYFLKYYFLSDYFQNVLIEKATGGTVKGIKGSILHKLQVKYPSFTEQTKIANFLSALDNKINQLTQKKNLLEQYKKGVMQKIFTQEIRFKDDNGNDFADWEEKSLGEVGSTYNGLTGKTKENFGVGKPYIQYKQIFDNSKIDISKFEFVDVTDNENQNKVIFGDVFFTVSSETPNEIGTASVLLDEIDELYLNSFCFGYRAKSLKILNPYFSQYLFRSESFRNEIVKLAQGSTRYNMSKVGLMKLTVKLPCENEQIKIANFLSAIDENINQITKQLQQTTQYKKGLLQQMFVQL